ncbi:fimbrial protein [Burkholderia anthina]|uniref:fimbrial protein n=1 Tax=Burkholderia anthina TaxID=179879 RepID=UPI00158888DE
MKKISHRASIVSLLLLSAGFLAATSAHAADGQVSFYGKIVPTTCSVDDDDLGIGLPPVSANALPEVGSVAGRTPFSLSLSGCAVGDGNPATVAVLFENNGNVDAASGRLKLDQGDDAASGVQLNVLDSDMNRVPLGAQTGANTKFIDIAADGTAKIDYFTEYYAEGDVKAGDARSRVEYSLMYN